MAIIKYQDDFFIPVSPPSVNDFTPVSSPNEGSCSFNRSIVISYGGSAISDRFLVDLAPDISAGNPDPSSIEFSALSDKEFQTTFGFTRKQYEKRKSTLENQSPVTFKELHEQAREAYERIGTWFKSTEDLNEDEEQSSTDGQLFPLRLLDDYETLAEYSDQLKAEIVRVVKTTYRGMGNALKALASYIPQWEGHPIFSIRYEHIDITNTRKKGFEFSSTGNKFLNRPYMGSPFSINDINRKQPGGFS